ncbi:MAG TPA: tetratricopeptide repeat protein, partial [Pirellulales bacterium]|nr:tetratricopeptide repeat protein [Pirellulales bacterium]
MLLATVVIVGALAPAIYFWHAFQVDENASSLLNLADRDEKRSEWLKAAENLYRYLQLRPNDVETLVRLAEDYQKGAKQPLQKARAVQFYARAISLAPDRLDLQRRQMALRLETGDHRGALEQSKKLLEEDHADAEALRVRAIALHRQKRLRSSVSDEGLLAAYRAAIDKNPDNVELAAGLALFYRSEMAPSKQQSRADLERLADKVMDNLAASPGSTAETFVARYLYRQQFNLPDADADLDRAISADTAKKTLSVWLLAGVRAQAAGDHEAAVKHFSDAIAIDPDDRRGRLGLGNAYAGLGDDARAIRAWRGGLSKSSPGDIEIELLIVAAEVRQGRWKRAKTELDRLEKKLASLAGPQQADLLAAVWSLRADAAIAQQQFGAALGPLKQALASKQAGAESLSRAGEIGQIQSRLGYCYQVLRQWDQAALAYQSAADLMPRDPAPRLAAAAAWEAAGRFDEAVRQYDDALPLKGVGANAWVAAANAECLRQRSLPLTQRNWQLLTSRIVKAKRELANDGSLEPLILTLVESEYDAALGLVDQALDRCRNNVEPAVTASADLVRRLALDYESWGRTE